MSAKPCMVAGNLQMVDRILETKRMVSNNHITLVRAFLFLCVAGMIYFELTYRPIDWPFVVDHPTVWFSVYVLMIMLFINGIYLLLMYLINRFTTSTLEITTRQQQLCGVSKSDPGFRIISPTSAAITSPNSSFPQYSPSSFTNRPSYNCAPAQQSFMASPGSCFNTSLGGLGPKEVVAYNWSPSPLQFSGCGGSPSFSSQHGSTSYVSGLLNSSCESVSPGLSPVTSRMQGSGYSPSGVGRGSPGSSVVTSGDALGSYLSGQNLSDGSSDLRQRHIGHGSSNKSSPLRQDDFISNPQDLDRYLQDTNAAKDIRLKSGVSDVRSPSPGFSFWSLNRMMDYIPIIQRYQYQLAPHSMPQSTTCVDSPPLDFSTCAVSEDVWSKLDIDYDQVEQWVENLRKWLCRTVLNRLIDEIAEVNKTLINIGSEEVQIGEVSLSTLKQWSLVKGQLVHKLSTLIPFLELTANQEYLVQRLKELGCGGCMSSFKWNGGGSFKGKPWEENLPTDSAIVMHILCCYMDLRLPSHPKYADGKTFTCQHFLRAPAGPDFKERKDHLLIYEVRLHPPHYNVVIDDTVWNIKPGRNNLFHAILLFLHHIKTKEHGMLRRVSLGLSGINILWVLDS